MVEEATRKCLASERRGTMISWMRLGMAGSLSIFSRPPSPLPSESERTGCSPAWTVPGGLPSEESDSDLA